VLVEGRGGVFDVKVDGHLVFSKHGAFRFPEVQEIIEEIRKRTPS
jgi:selT/selW/selH-like putative selenoprotein